jgi:hypothetical protein
MCHVDGGTYILIQALIKSWRSDNPTTKLSDEKTASLPLRHGHGHQEQVPFRRCVTAVFNQGVASIPSLRLQESSCGIPWKLLFRLDSALEC